MPTIVKNNYFHDSTRFLLLVFYWLGLFPVSGLGDRNCNKLRFRYKSLLFFCNILTISGQVLKGVCSMLFLLIHESTGRSLYNANISLFGMCSSIQLMLLAHSWPELVTKIGKYEASLPPVALRRKLKIRLIVPVIGTICIICAYITGEAVFMKTANACKPDKQGSLLNAYIGISVPYLDIFPSQSWHILVIEMIKIQSASVLCFIDFLIIVICIYLIDRFQGFNEFVDRHKERHPPVWNVIRLHYTRLSSLVGITDKTIGLFILVSFANNLMQICILLFKIMNKGTGEIKQCPPEISDKLIHSAIRGGHFVFSLLFALTRTLLVGHLAAKVQEEAKESVYVLNNLQDCCFDDHAKRLLEEIHAKKPSLSGLNFFQVSNGAILSMFASIATYELVLLQLSMIVE